MNTRYGQEILNSIMPYNIWNQKIRKKKYTDTLNNWFFFFESKRLGEIFIVGVHGTPLEDVIFRDMNF